MANLISLLLWRISRPIRARFAAFDARNQRDRIVNDEIHVTYHMRTKSIDTPDLLFYASRTCWNASGERVQNYRIIRLRICIKFKYNQVKRNIASAKNIRHLYFFHLSGILLPALLLLIIGIIQKFKGFSKQNYLQ